jgi:hypothetical protein
LIASKSSAERIGFGDVSIHTCFQAPLAVAFHGVGGKRNDRSPLPATFPFTDERGRLKAIYYRHLNIHENDVEPLLRRQSHSLLAAAGNLHPVSVFFEKSGCQFLVDGIVLGQKYR